MQHQSFQTTREYINLGLQLAPTLPKLYVPPIGANEREGAEKGVG